MSTFGRSKRVYIMTPTLVPHDAIGNDVRGMTLCLQRHGFQVKTYAESVHPDFAHIAEKLNTSLSSFWSDKNALLIYHHSIGWQDGQDVLAQAACQVVIRHHNVTPSRFFEPYSAGHARACAAGEYATAEVARTPGAVFWGASRFNCDGLVELGASPDRCRVLAPFHLTERLAETPMAADVVCARKSHRGTKLLFVGGLKPNKGHIRLIQVLAAYVRYVDPNAVLMLPGTFDPRLSNYTDLLRRYAARLGVESNVLFIGPVTDSQLRAYYFSADVFLCLSEHEGFCVPLLEAMYFRVPIVAHKRTAIPETVGEAGLLWEEDEAECIVESIAACAEGDERRHEVVELGWERYSRQYSQKRIEEKFLSLVEEATRV
jgi:glycosyltransferase involved in cell wall biosynthesis